VGEGPGLAIITHIAQLHDGEIRNESALNKGANVMIQLPIMDDSWMTKNKLFSGVKLKRETYAFNS
jgi:signal transduction histidine kinase